MLDSTESELEVSQCVPSSQYEAKFGCDYSVKLSNGRLCGIISAPHENHGDRKGKLANTRIGTSKT